MKKLILIVILLLFPVAVLADNITLMWDPNTESDMKEYRIYRSTAPGINPENVDPANPDPTVGVKVGTVTHPVVTFTNEDVPDGTHYWVVTAVDTRNLESDPSNEVIITLDSAFDVTVIRPGDYTVARLAVGDEYYLDRAYTLASIPEELSGGEWIRTKNEDKDDTTDDFLTFRTRNDSVIYVAYDSRVTTLPTWLVDFEATTLMVGVIGDVASLKLYRKSFPAGVIVFGGNMAGDAAGADSNYVVIAQVSDDTPPQPPKNLLIGIIEMIIAFFQWIVDALRA